MEENKETIEEKTAEAETEAAETPEDSPEEKSDKTAKEVKKAKKKAQKEAKKRKKEVKRLKKEYDSRKKEIPIYKRTIICPPDKAASSKKTVIIGYICRAIIIFFAVFGVVFFAADGFGIINSEDTGLNGGWIALWSAIFTAIFTFTAIFPIRKIAVPAGIAATAGIVAAMLLPDPVNLVYQAAIKTYNTALEHLSDIGYYAMAEKVVDINFTAGSSTLLLRRALFLAVLAVSAIYVFCLVRRIRLGGFLIAGLVSAGILWLVFTYNISRSNWGVTLIIASFTAVILMFSFDNLYIKASKPDETDPDSGMFGTSEEPPLPEAYLQKKAAKAEKKAEKQAKKALKAKKKKQKKEKKPISVDEELTDYFTAPSKKKKEKVKKEKVKLTPEQKKVKAAEAKTAKAEAKAKKKADRKMLEANRRYKNAVMDAKCAGGGFAGAGIFLLCMLLLIIPTFSVSHSFKTVDVIDKKFKVVREYVTAILMGDSPTLDLLSYENDPVSKQTKSTDPTPLYYTGKKLMTVQSNSRYNVYLKGWVAMNYNDETGTWETATSDTDEFALYRRIFGTTVDPNETMMYNFFSLMDPTSITSAEELDYSSRTKSNTSYGFVVTQINMKRTEELESKLLYMPSYNIRAFNIAGNTSSGKSAIYLRAYGSNEASKITYANYFDGLYTSYRARNDTDGYATVSMISTQKTSSWYRTVAEMIANFNNSRYAITNGVTAPAEGDEWYTLTFADGSTVKYKVEYRNAEGGLAGFTQDEDGTKHYTDSDGYTYILTQAEIGNNVYKFNSDGELLRKYVENIPEDKKYDEEGDEIVYTAPTFPFAIRYFELMTDAERSRLAYDYTVLDYYTNYVYDNYTQKSSSQIIKDLTAKIMSEATEKTTEEYTEIDEETGEEYTATRTIEVKADFSKAAASMNYYGVLNDDVPSYTLKGTITDKNVYIQRHKLVMAFVDYLTDEENFTYTLNPKQSDSETLIGVEKFLADTHEGYCVQFATALVLMLREAGIPARYVDGYIASNFSTAYGDEKVASYTTSVTDKNAHAWVEVWYDGIGWVQYEATPEYYSGLYEVTSERKEYNSNTGGDSDGDEGEEDEDGDTLTDEELAELIRQQQEEARRALIRKIIIISLCVLAGAAAIFLFFFYFWTRARFAQKKRDALVAKFAAVDPENPENLPTRAEVRSFSDLITDMLNECGLAPKIGEFRDEYAKRIAGYNPGALAQATEIEKLSEFERSKTIMHENVLSTMFDTMAAEEFGYGADAVGMPLMARFWRRMYAYEYSRHVNIFRRIWLWLFKRKM